MVRLTGLVHHLVAVLCLCSISLSENTLESAGVEIKCEDVKLQITVRRRFFDEKRIPFKPEHLQLGANTTALEPWCGPSEQMSDHDAVLVISARLQDCGAVSRVHVEWLVYYNQLLLFPALASTSSASVIIRGPTTVIPVECWFKRKQRVSAQPLTPTWLPMTSTISVFGLLHFSLRTMEDDCTTVRSSSVYQRGAAVFLEASVEAPLHRPLTLYVDSCVATLKPDPLSMPSYKFITRHGCLVDSMLPGSSSRFLRRQHDNRLCFSIKAFQFKQESVEQMFISCHLKATLKQKSQSHLNKACFFHRPTFSWHATEGDDALCECCLHSDDCVRHNGEENNDHTVHTTQSDTERKHEGDTTTGPLHILEHRYWTGRLSVGD